MTLVRIVSLLAMVAVLVAPGVFAQHAPDAKSFVLKGKVTKVDKERLTVDHGEVKGYMGAMTMPYKVDKADILARVKAGDQIEATVYKDDYTLYDVKVVPVAEKANGKAQK